MKSEKTIAIFTHLPKTAGTCLNYIISQQYPFNHLFNLKAKVDVMEAIERLTVMDKTHDLEIISGHTGFGIHQYLASPFNYITLLRHPTERMISHYFYFWKRYSPNISLEKLCIIEQNLMTRYISGLEFELLKKSGSRASLGRWKHKGKIEDFPQSTKETLETAKQNLQKYKIVGLTERFPETLVLFKRELQWKNLLYKKRTEVCT